MEQLACAACCRPGACMTSADSGVLCRAEEDLAAAQHRADAAEKRLQAVEGRLASLGKTASVSPPDLQPAPEPSTPVRQAAAEVFYPLWMSPHFQYRTPLSVACCPCQLTIAWLIQIISHIQVNPIICALGGAAIQDAAWLPPPHILIELNRFPQWFTQAAHACQCPGRQSGGHVCAAQDSSLKEQPHQSSICRHC